tara:strand:+ start:13336 stop:15606 length:2271 start_codon:yes stop_codon:yes gene_type:complete
MRSFDPKNTLKKCYKFLYASALGDVVLMQGTMSTPPPQYNKYTFGAFTLDTRRGTLEKNGEQLKIRAQSFQVLAFLLSRHGILTSKEELHAEIWGKKIVSDDSLTHCLLDIRKCIEDVNKDIIRTVPRRGYIFEAACEQEALPADNDEAPVTTPRKQRKTWLTAAIVSVTAACILIYAFKGPDPVIVPGNTIAVLPFADRSETQDQRYLANGLAEEVLNLLARSPDLRVIARTSSFSFAEDTPDVATIRELLSVAYVLEGSVHRRQGRISVSAQLVDTRNSATIWSENYEGRTEHLVSWQKQIADEVLARVAPGADGSKIVPARRSFSAEELMLLAHFYELEVRERAVVDHELLAEAISLYQDAITADPTSALAYSRLAGALLYQGDMMGAEAAVLNARSLDPGLSEVQEALGAFYWSRGLPGAGAAWLRAIQLNPNNADAHSNYAYWSWMQANDDAPEALYREALEIDPVSLSRHAALGNFLGHQGRVDDTRELIGRIEKRFDSPESYRVIARLFELIGELNSSIAWTIRARNNEPDNADHTSALAELYAEIGDAETALELEPDPGIGLLFKLGRYDELIEKAELQIIEEPDDIYLHYLLAFAHNVRGDAAAALANLRAIGQPLAQREEIRQAADIESFVTYVDALDASGDSARAMELADWFYRKPHTKSTNWWIHLQLACTLAVMKRDEEALAELELLTTSPRLPWTSVLRDSRCLQRYVNQPRYKAVLTKVSQRRDQLQRDLPAVLKAHNIGL